MKRIFFIFVTILFLTYMSMYADFEKTYGGTNDDNGYSVQQTTDGGYIIAGETSSFGNGGSDVYLIKVDSTGAMQWTKTYGGTNYDSGESVQQTADGGYIIAGTTLSYGNGGSDVYLIKVDSTGVTQWTKTYGGTNDDVGHSVQQTTDMGYIIAGETMSFGSGDRDVYLIKVNSTGATQWTKTYGGTDDDAGYSVQQTTDGGYIIAGETSSFGNGGSDVYLIKVNSTGATQWTKTYGGASIDAANSVQQTMDNGYIIAGYTESFGSGLRDVYLLKLDSTGATQWTKTYGGTNFDSGESVQQTPDGGYIIAGSTSSFGDSLGDTYLIKINSTGATQWTKTYGGTNFDFDGDVKLTTDNGYIIVGSTESFGNGGNDVYLIKIDGEMTTETTNINKFVNINEVVKKAEDLKIVGSDLPEYRGTYVPDEGPLTMKLDGVTSGTLRFRIFTLTGETIFDSEISCDSDGNFELNIPTDIASGTYIIKVEGPKFSFTKKLAVLR